MLELKNIYKTFNPGTINEKRALNGLNLKLNEGDFVTVIGGNGAGKSTMLNAVAGTWLVDEGQILIDNIDVTKLSVYTRDIGLAGIEVYDLLRDEYDIQIEFGDIGNILAYLSIGDRAQEVERLVSALAEIRRRFQKDKSGLLDQEYIDPQVVTSPQEAFYAEKCSLPLRETEGKVCSEFVMCYPPGIPILAPGEMVTQEIVEYILYARDKGCSMQGMEDPKVEHLQVLKGGI